MPPQAHLVRLAPSAKWHTGLKEELGSFIFVASLANAVFLLGVMNGERVYLLIWMDKIVAMARQA